MKTLIKLVLLLTLGVVSNTCVAQVVHISKYSKGDTVYNKKTKTIQVIDSLQYRDPSVKSWTTNFYTTHYPGDAKYSNYDVVESALVKLTPEKWAAIRKKLNLK